MGLLSTFPRPLRWVEANHVIAGGGSTKRQGPADIAKSEHGQPPPAEPRGGRKNRLQKIQDHTLLIVFLL
jgi:hypothetical protein